MEIIFSEIFEVESLRLKKYAEFFQISSDIYKYQQLVQISSESKRTSSCRCSESLEYMNSLAV